MTLIRHRRPTREPIEPTELPKLDPFSLVQETLDQSFARKDYRFGDFSFSLLRLTVATGAAIVTARGALFRAALDVPGLPGVQVFDRLFAEFQLADFDSDSFFLCILFPGFRDHC